MIFSIPFSMFAGAILTALLGSRINPKKIAIFFSFLNLLICLNLKNNYLVEKIGLGGWAAPYGVELSPDPFGLILVFLISLLGFLGIFYASTFKNIGKSGMLFFSLSMFLLGALQSICLSWDLFNMYVWLELSSICAFALIGYKTKKGAFAAFRYLLTSGIAGVLFLFGVGFVYSTTGTLNLTEITNSTTLNTTFVSGFVLITLSLLMKMAITPFHFWLPASYANSPNKTLALIPAIMTKAPAIVLLRIVFFLPTEKTNWMINGELIAYMGSIAVIYGSLMAIRQSGLKKLLAYSSIAQLGLVGIAIGLLNFQGAVIQIIAHSIMKFSLFCAVGALAHFGSITTIQDLKKLWKQSPMLSWVFVICGFSLAGIPPFAGFFAKYHLVAGALDSGNLIIVGVIVISSLLTAGYFFKIMEKIIYSKHDKENTINIPATTSFPIMLTCLCTILFGFFLPGIFEFLGVLK